MSRLAYIGIGFCFALGGSGTALANGPAGLPMPDTRSMVKLVDISKLTAKPVPLYCIFMRMDGSQFASSMQLKFSSTLQQIASSQEPRRSNSVSLQVEDADAELPAGLFPGVVTGIPLMDEEVFDLRADGKDGYQQKQIRLAGQFSFDSAGKPVSLSYRATVLRFREDMMSASAVGYCYMREAIEILPRVSR